MENGGPKENRGRLRRFFSHRQNHRVEKGDEVGQNFGKDDRVSSAKHSQHFRRPKIFRASDLVGGLSMGNRCLSGVC